MHPSYPTDSTPNPGSKHGGPGRDMTARQLLFVKEYLIDRNARRAALRAGYTPASANAASMNLLKHPRVRMMLEAVQAATVRTLAATQDRLIEEYEALALFDPALIFNEDGTIKPILEMPEVARRALTGIELGTGFTGKGKDRRFTPYVKKIKIDKLGALDSLAKIKRMMQDDRVQVGIGLAIHIHTGEYDGKAKEIRSS